MAKATKTALALGVAADYRRHVARGDVVLAGQCLRTIEELCGSFRGGRLVLPWDVRAAMKGGA